MQIISMLLSDLTTDPNNARTHDGTNLSAIRGSFKKFGQQMPILIDNGGVILAGNGRYLVAKELGWEKIDCIVSDLLTATEKTAYALADNRTAELADWDRDILGLQLLALQDDGFDIGEIGFELDTDDEDDEKAKKKEKEFNHEYLVVVECKDDQEQMEVYNKLNEEGRNCKIMS